MKNEMPRNDYFRKFVAIFLLIGYASTGFLEAFLSIKFPPKFLDNSAIGAAVGVVFFFPDVAFRLIEIFYEVKNKIRSKPDATIGFKANTTIGSEIDKTQKK